MYSQSFQEPEILPILNVLGGIRKSPFCFAILGSVIASFSSMLISISLRAFLAACSSSATIKAMG
jgi:hypothetical protein